MESWYKVKAVPKGQIDSGEALAAIRVAMEKCVSTVNRKEGNGMDLIKTHAPLHTPSDIRLFGCASNFISGPLESSHKDHCKKPSKLTQKRSDLMDEQVAKRLSERMVLDAANSLHFSPKDSETIPSHNTTSKEVGGSKLSLSVSPVTGGCLSYKRSYARKWLIRRDKSPPPRFFPRVAEEFLVRIVCENVELFSDGHPVPELEITCFTTHRSNGYIFRAHPDCHGKTWYDWVNISFLYDGVAEPISVPGQILMFVDFRKHGIPFMDHVEGYVGPGTYAVVRCLDTEPTPLKDSVCTIRTI